MATVAVVLAGVFRVAAAGEPAGARGVELAWRDDPRVPAEGPTGGGAARGPSRRAQRRAAVSRRRMPAQADDQGDPGGIVVGDDSFMRCHPDDLRDARQPTVAAGRTAAGGGFSGPPVCPPVTVRRIESHRGEPVVAPSWSDDGAGREPAAGLRFDLHKPAGPATARLPLVVWIPGDSWRDAARAACPIEWLAEEGYAVASIGYRSCDTAAFPAQLDDCRAAIAAIVQHADAWGIDPGRVAVAGSGGGGHLAALVGLADDPASAAAGWPGVAAVCAIAAPTNLVTLGPEHDRSGSAASRLVGGPLPEYREKAQFASPASHVSPDDPPVLVVHGAADTVVRPRQACEFDASLKAAGVDSALVLLPGIGHKPALGRGTPAGQSILAFLERTIGTGAGPDAAAAAGGPPAGSTP